MFLGVCLGVAGGRSVNAAQAVAEKPEAIKDGEFSAVLSPCHTLSHCTPHPTDMSGTALTCPQTVRLLGSTPNMS